KRIELGGDVGQEKDRLVRVEGKDLQPGQALVLRILPDGGLLFRIERPYTCHAAYGTRWKELPPRKRRTPIELILHRTHQHDIAIELADSEQHAVYERVVKGQLRHHEDHRKADAGGGADETPLVDKKISPRERNRGAACANGTQSEPVPTECLT